MDLNDRGGAGDREVMRIFRSRDEAAGREPLGATHVHAVAHSHEEGAGEDGDLLIGGMEMRLNDVAGGETEPDGVNAGAAGIALEHREAGVSGQKGGARTPFYSRRRVHLGSGGNGDDATDKKSGGDAHGRLRKGRARR